MGIRRPQQRQVFVFAWYAGWQQTGCCAHEMMRVGVRPVSIAVCSSNSLLG